jgi:hypothetical protein
MVTSGKGTERKACRLEGKNGRKQKKEQRGPIRWLSLPSFLLPFLSLLEKKGGGGTGRSSIPLELGNCVQKSSGQSIAVLFLLELLSFFL